MLPQFRRDPLTFVVQVAQRYDGLARLRIGPRDLLLVAHPEAMRHVLLERSRNYVKNYAALDSVLGQGLVSANGDQWLRQRRLMQPAFHHRQVAALADAMIDETAKLREGWRAAARAGRPLDIAEEMKQLTQAIIVRTMFSGSVGADGQRIADAFTTVLEVSERRNFQLVRLPERIPTPDNRRYAAAARFLEEKVYAIIAERQRSGEHHDDLLDMLLAARDAETGEGMSLKQIRDEVVTIYFAGHETTATVLTWTLHTLSRYPDVARRVRAEFAAALAGRDPGPADIAAMPYTRQVIDEVLRLFPPTWMVTRGAVADDEIAGHHIPAGAMVIVSPYATHRMPQFWPNPEGFDPERFAPEGAAGRHKFAYLPFISGPRKCIGDTFALVEMQLVLPMLLQHFELACIPGYMASPRAAGTLRPSGPVWMRAEAL